MPDFYFEFNRAKIVVRNYDWIVYDQAEKKCDLLITESDKNVLGYPFYKN